MTTITTTSVIINPSSQGGRTGTRWQSLRAEFTRIVGTANHLLTQYKGHAAVLAKQAVENGCKTLVVVGGDGTLSEVVDGVTHNATKKPDCNLGLIPLGTGGDFRRTVGISKQPVEAMAVIAAGKTRSLDVGIVHYGSQRVRRAFVNIASLGVSGLVTNIVNNGSKKLGSLAYVLGTFRASFGYQNRRVKMIFDGDPSTQILRRVYTMAIANGRYFGGGMPIAPTANPSDGFLDVVWIGDVSFAKVLSRTAQVYSGNILQWDKVHHRRVRSVEVEVLDGPALPLDVDGEVPGHMPASFSLVPNAISMFVPE